MRNALDQKGSPVRNSARPLTRIAVAKRLLLHPTTTRQPCEAQRKKGTGGQALYLPLCWVFSRCRGQSPHLGPCSPTRMLGLAEKLTTSPTPALPPLPTTPQPESLQCQQAVTQPLSGVVLGGERPVMLQQLTTHIACALLHILQLQYRQYISIVHAEGLRFEPLFCFSSFPPCVSDGKATKIYLRPFGDASKISGLGIYPTWQSYLNT